ncbi:hypothetical protein GJ496_009862 [Pomphorhynchus laevis]|nr:hypothetical protein GJ496_009862 [Pomphorhynchus laevis]
MSDYFQQHNCGGQAKTVPTIRGYIETEEEWSEYHEQLLQNFLAHGVTDEVNVSSLHFNQTRMKSGQSYADLIVQLRGKARFCDLYQPQITNERHAIDKRIRGVIAALTPHQYVRNVVLQMTNPSLDDKIWIVHTYELMQTTAGQFESMRSFHKTDLPIDNDNPQLPSIKMQQIDAVNKKFYKGKTYFDNSRQWHGIQCKSCGRYHREGHDCPATRQRCRRCGILGHFAIRCRRS